MEFMKASKNNDLISEEEMKEMMKLRRNIGLKLGLLNLKGKMINDPTMVYRFSR